MIGCPLMQRTSRNVTLTPAGKDFLVYARQILKLHAEAINVAKLAKKSVTLKVGVPDDYAQRFLPSVLRFFKETYPDLLPEVVWTLFTKPELWALNQERYPCQLKAPLVFT